MALTPEMQTGNRDVLWAKVMADMRASGEDRGYALAPSPGRTGDFAPKDDESYDQWVNRIKEYSEDPRNRNIWAGSMFGSPAGSTYLLKYLQDNKKSLEHLMQRAPTTKEVEEAKALAEEEAYKKWRVGVMQRLDAFSQKMNMSVEDLLRSGDVGATSLRDTARVESNRAGMRAGVTGGISDLNSIRAQQDALARYQLQRQAMGSQAMTGLLGSMSQMGQEEESRRRYEQGLDLDLQAAQEAARQRAYAEAANRASGMWGLAGGIAGGIVTRSPAGVTAGQQIGSSLGSTMYGQQNPYRPTQPRYPGRRGYSGYGLSGPYSGAQ